MASCVVRDWQGKEAGSATLDLKVAKESTAVDLMHRAVRVSGPQPSGHGKHPHPREVVVAVASPTTEGTGRAVGFHPHPPAPRWQHRLRTQAPPTTAMNRKERRLALRTALMARIDDVTVVKDFGSALEAPKTREITDALGRLGIAADAKVLIVLSSPSDVVRRSVRNLEKVKLIAANQLNVFDLLHANALVLGEDALATIQEVYGDD